MHIDIKIPFKKGKVKNKRIAIKSKPKAHENENWTQTIHRPLVNPKRRKCRHRPHGINNPPTV